MNDADAIARIAVSREHVRWLRGASSPHNDRIADGIESLLALLAAAPSSADPEVAGSINRESLDPGCSPKRTLPAAPSADVIARIVQRVAMFTKPICPKFEAPAGHDGALDQCRHCMYRYDTHLLRDAADALASSGAPPREEVVELTPSASEE